MAERSVRYANDKLQGHYKLQAFARDINLFHLRQGHRSRITIEGDGYQVLDGGPEHRDDQAQRVADVNHIGDGVRLVVRLVVALAASAMSGE